MQDLGSDLEIIRVEANSYEDLLPAQFEFVTSAVAAIWQSHKNALEKFLSTEDNFALILEDDFLIKKNFVEEFLRIKNLKNFDFVQVGFLTINKKELFEIKYSNCFDFILKTLSKFTVIFPNFSKRFSEKFFLLRQIGKPFHLVLDDVRPGAHAYIVSRHFASKVISLNDPTFLSADLFYMSLAQMRTFDMARLRKSIVEQSGSASSIKSRFLSQE